MRTVMAVMVAAVMAAGTARAGEGCPYLQSMGAAGGTGCAAHASCAGKSAAACPAGQKVAGQCPGCDQLAASGKALRDAGASLEVFTTQAGYIVLATAPDAATVAKLRQLSADRWAGFRALAANAKLCKSCAAFEAAMASDHVKVEQLEVSTGVMTVFTGLDAGAVAALKATCGASCGLKTASADAPKEKADKPTI